MRAWGRRNRMERERDGRKDGGRERKCGGAEVVGKKEARDL